MKIYAASSWRNPFHEHVVKVLRAADHEVYDFKDPEDNGGTGFAWSAIDPNWKRWGPQIFRVALSHPTAVAGFDSDFKAMTWADACVLTMPCGRSAHIEAGWMVGQGKSTAIYLNDAEPELMYRMVSALVLNDDELLKWADLQHVKLLMKSRSHEPA